MIIHENNEKYKSSWQWAKAHSKYHFDINKEETAQVQFIESGNVSPLLEDDDCESCKI